MKNKIAIISISGVLVLLLIIGLFCVIYFNINVDITKDIDKVFSQSEVTYYYPTSCPPSEYIYQLSSEDAKEIVKRNLKDIKFKHTTIYPILYGGSSSINCGDLSIGKSYYLFVNNKALKLTDEISEAFNKINDEIIAIATRIPNKLFN